MMLRVRVTTAYCARTGGSLGTARFKVGGPPAASLRLSYDRRHRSAVHVGSRRQPAVL